MLNQTENTLYILQNLANTESKDLEFTEIEVYYEDDKGNEGSSIYDMPTIADDAIITINRLTNEIAEFEKELDKDNFAVVPRSLSRDMRIAYHESIEKHEDCQENLGCPDDQWTAMLEAHEGLKKQE